MQIVEILKMVGWIGAALFVILIFSVIVGVANMVSGDDEDA